MENEYDNAADELDAIMNGDIEIASDDDEYNGDTDQQSDSVDDDNTTADTNDLNDGDDQDTTDSDDLDTGNNEEENTLVDDDNADEENDESNLDADEADDDYDEEDNESDNGDTDKSENADSLDGSDKVDYQKQYEELQKKSETAQNFYDKVTSEFKVNGKMTRGYSDPDKVIQSIQMAGGVNAKFQHLKKSKAFLRSLEESGMIQDKSKFDLAINIMNGDENAIKQHMQNLELDPLTLDMEEIEYAGKRHAMSDVEMQIESTIDNAKSRGVENQMNDLLLEGWDNDSVMRVLSTPGDGEILSEQMESGIFEHVKNRIEEIANTDVSGSFGDRSDYEKYQIAEQELRDEYNEHLEKTASAGNAAENSIVEDSKKTEYTAQVKKREAEAKKARDKATSFSKPKKKKVVQKKKKDINDLSGDDFMKRFNSEILGH